MKKACYLLVVTVSIFIVACTKAGSAADTDDPYAIDNSDDVFPVIVVTRPMANQVYHSGDSIIVEGKVTDNKVMYKGRVQIKNDANGFMVADNYYETHFLQVLNYRLAYKAVVTAPTDFSVILEFQDHGGNPVSSTTKVKVNP
jgi:hypothetical protein